MLFNFDKRYLYITLAVIAVFELITMGTAGIIATLLTIPGVLIAISFHEFAHAWMAVRLGDDTPSGQGRVSVDPLRHIDPIGFIMLLFCGFGWGKPVEIDSRNFRGNKDVAEALVALAGPIMNFIMSIVLTIILCAIYKFSGTVFLYSTAGLILAEIIQYAILMNIGLGVFNLIPLPPLDGSKIFIKFMPYKAKNWIYAHEQVFYIIFLLIWITGISSYIISPIINAILGAEISLIGALFGVI